MIETRQTSAPDNPQGNEPGLLPSEDHVSKVMPQILSVTDMTVIFSMALFWISNVTGTVIGGTSAFTYWIFGMIAFFVPCCLICAQLGAMYPHEGSIYNWTYHAFHRVSPSQANFMSFFVGIAAWLPGLLSIVSAADVIVSCLQVLNPSWLVPPWQQGLVIIGVVLMTGVISTQRTQTVKYIILTGFVCTGSLVMLIVSAAVVWLMAGHHSVTNFADPGGWQVSFDPNTGNIALLGTVTLALLGATGPMMMSGELKPSAGRRAVRHLLWGAILVIVGYLATTLALLIVQGQAAALNTGNPVQLVIATVDTGLGKLAGDISAVFLMLFFIVVAVIYNVLFARLLMTASVDRRLPKRFSRLNKHRVPATAVWFQTVLSVVISALIFFLVPLFPFFGDPAALTNKVYLSTAAALLLVWAFSYLFPFIDFLLLARRGGWQRMRYARVAPLPILVLCCIVGSLVCIATIVDTLLFSFAPSLIPNNVWTGVIGTYAFICIGLCAIGGMIGSSESVSEDFQSELDELVNLDQENTRHRNS